MQEVEMFSHIKMRPKRLTGNIGYMTLQAVCSASPVVVLAHQLIPG